MCIRDSVTVSTFDRLILPEYLPNIDRLVYIDIDTILNGDIFELYNHELSVAGFAARTAPNARTSTLVNRFERTIRIQEYDANNAKKFRTLLAAQPDILNPYCNAGVLVMSLDRLRELDFTTKTMAFVQKYGFEDQEAINMFLQGSYVDLGMEWNAQPYHDHFDTAKLVHWAGGNKPWNKNRSIRKSELWLKHCEHEEPVA